MLQAQGEDELGLSKGDVIEVLSKDYKISGDEGWWTGKCNGKVMAPNTNLNTKCISFSLNFLHFRSASSRATSWRRVTSTFRTCPRRSCAGSTRRTSGMSQ